MNRKGSIIRAFCDLLLSRYLGIDIQNVSSKISKATHHLMEVDQLKNVHAKAMITKSPNSITLGGIIH